MTYNVGDKVWLWLPNTHKGFWAATVKKIMSDGDILVKRPGWVTQYAHPSKLSPHAWRPDHQGWQMAVCPPLADRQCCHAEGDILVRIVGKAMLLPEDQLRYEGDLERSTQLDRNFAWFLFELGVTAEHYTSIRDARGDKPPPLHLAIALALREPYNNKELRRFLDHG